MSTDTPISSLIRERFSTLSWPTLTDEKWRRSDPEAIPFDVLSDSISESEIEAFRSVDMQLHKALNTHPTGIYYRPFSFLDTRKKMRSFPEHDQDKKIPTFATDVLTNALSESNEKVEAWKMLRFLSTKEEEATAGSIYVSKNTSLRAPLRIHLEGRKNADAVVAPQLYITVEKGAHLDLCLSIEGDGFFLPGVFVYVSAHAKVHYHLLQKTSKDSTIISSSFFLLENDSMVYSTSGQLGGMMSIDSTHTIVNGRGAHASLNGFYFGEEDQLFDMRTFQSHRAPNTTSRALYHGAAVEQAHTVFRGMIAVSEEATDTDAYLTNNNLLLGEEARMDSIPCLNINTNEVRCSHGSTTGDLDPSHVFYLMSRGFSQSEAKHLLIEGFFEKTFDTKFEKENNDALHHLRTRTKNI